MAPQSKTITIKTKEGLKVFPYNITCAISSTIDNFGYVIDLCEGSQIHCEDGPAIIYPDGEQVFYVDGIRLTEDQFKERLKIEPKYRFKRNGVVVRTWFNKKTKKRHRVDGPAIESSDGSFYVHIQNDKIHRADGPAVRISSSTRNIECYYINDKLHNLYGPARIDYLTETKSYYIHGRNYSKEDFMKKKLIAKRPRKKKAATKGINNLKEVVCYSSYICTNILVNNKLGEASPAEIAVLIDSLDTTNITLQLKRSASLGIYHSVIGADLLKEVDFETFFPSLGEEVGPIYIMDSGQNTVIDLYKIYTAVYIIQSIDSSSVFSTILSEPAITNAIGYAIDDVSNGAPLRTKEDLLSIIKEDTVSKMSNDIADSSEDMASHSDSDIFSWVLPLALAAGASSLFKYKKKNKKASIRSRSEAVCQQQISLKN